MKMYIRISLVTLLSVILSACSPSQQITNTWINPDLPDNAPYESIFVMVLSPNSGTGFSVEDRMAGVLATRGQKCVLSSSVFPPNLKISDDFTREQMAEAIKRTGCGGVLVIAQLDVTSVESYHPGVAWNPGYYGYYGSYYGYYNYYSPMVYSPGYYSSDKTFYIETNFYDVETDRHLWLIQSEASNPAGIDGWFDGYINNLFDELSKENLLK